MKRSFLYIVVLVSVLLWMTACTTWTDDSPVGGTGVLHLSLSRNAIPELGTRAIDDDLVVDLFDADGTLFRHFASGEVPEKMVVKAGVRYTLRVYTDNQDTWQTANNGVGEGCYAGETTVMVGEDETFYCTYRVPMTNYAVQFILPEYFHDLFAAYTFTLSGGDRQVTLTEGQKAYLSPENGFSYQLQVTNIDGVTHSQDVQTQQDVRAGLLYSIKYSYSYGTSVEVSGNAEP